MLYNFMRPYSTLRFGSVTRTPATQAGLAQKRLNFLNIFVPRHAATRFAVVRSGAVAYHEPIGSLRCAA